MIIYKKYSILVTVIALFLSASVQAADDYVYFTGQHQAFKQTSGKVVGSYIANWSQPSAVDAVKGDNLSHILYAFLTICGPSARAEDAAVCAGKSNFQLAENATSKDKEFAAKFITLKQKFPHVKILPSVGGAGPGSDAFIPMTATSASRAAFVQSVVNYLKANTVFDGIDIDWESPLDKAQGEAYADLMADLRSAFNALGQERNRQYLITSAIGGYGSGPANINFRRAAPFMDYVFLMSYDLYGGWSNANIGHHTALSKHAGNGNSAISAAQGAANLMSIGVPAEKLVLGVANYARGWDGVQLSSSGSRIGGKAVSGFPKKQFSWDEEGVAIYSRIVSEVIGASGLGVNGFEVIYDSDCDCHYAWRNSDLALVGFDHPRDVANKAQYAVYTGLAGVFAWEYMQDNGDLLSAMNYGVGNAKEGASGSPSSVGNMCTGLPAWNETTVYTTEQVYYRNQKYKAISWNQAKVPTENSGDFQVWQLLDYCKGSASSTASSVVSSVASSVVRSSSLSSAASSSLASSVVSSRSSSSVASSNSSLGGLCNSASYVAGTAYTAGQLVKNAGNEYQCKVSGWCGAAAWAYAPGVGTYWTDAWTLVKSCAAASSTSVAVSSVASSLSSSVRSSTVSSVAASSNASGCGVGVKAYPNWTQVDWSGKPDHANGGDLMSYNGVVYAAVWWTASVPGSDSSWTKKCTM